MAGSNYLTTYYAKRIIGDSAAASAASALLQTGEGITADTWIISRTKRLPTNEYGIIYNYDYVNGVEGEADKIEFVGKNTVTAWVRLDTGDTYILGHVGIGGNPESNYSLYTIGAVWFNIGSSDNTTDKQFLIGHSGQRYLSLGGGGIQAYDASNNFTTLYLNYSGGQTYVGGSLQANGKVGIGYDPDTSGNTYKLYVNGTTALTSSLTLLGTTYDTAVIHFSRNDSINYINIPTGGSLGFSVGGNEGGKVQVVIESSNLNCYADARSALGSTTIRWNGVYSTTGNFSDNVTIASGKRIGCSGGSLYIGNSGNESWVYVQDMASQASGTPWKIHQNGNAEFTGTVSAGVLSAGSRETTSGPSSITYSNRITIVPYFHTGGPWYIKSGDDSSNAYLALYYNTTQLMRIKHDGTQMVDWKGNANTATKWKSAQTVYVTLGTASTTTTIQGGSSSAQTIGVNGTLGTGNGGTGNTSFTANRLAWTETATKFTAGYHYASSTKVGICYTSEPSYNFAVSGTTYLGGNTTLEGSSTISRAGKSINWNQANTYAILRMTTQSGWSPLLALKANTGWWTMGHYNSSGYNDHLLFTFLADVDVSGVTNAKNHMDYTVRLIPTVYATNTTTTTDRAFVTAPWASSKAAVGGADGPVYINDSGVATACTTYANAYVKGITPAGTTAQFWRGDNAWSSTLNGAFTANGTITANGGYLKSTLNSNTVTIGSANTGYCHIQNSADIPFWFNKNILMEKGKTIGQADSVYRPFKIFLGRNTTSGSNALNANSPLIEFSNSDRSQYCQLIYDDNDSLVPPDSLTLVGNQDGIKFILKNGPLWIQGGSNAGGNVNRLTTSAGMPGNMQYNVSRRGTQIYSNGIAFCDPYNGNSNSDAGWIRHQETTGNSGELEIAVGDDGNETIVCRQYKTDNTVNRTLTLMNSSGYAIFPSYINIGGHEKNASSPTYVWGSNSSDNYLRSYQTSKLSVATSASCTGNAATATSATKATQDGSGNTITSYYCTLSTAQTFTGNKTFNSICYFANGTTYYVNKNGDSRLRYLGCGNLDASTSYAIRIGGNAYISGHHYFGNGTTYYINSSGTGNLNALTVNATTASSSTATGALIVKGGIGAAGKIYGSQVYNAVWNDYAECRQVETEEPGRCVTESPSGKMILTQKRLMPGCKLTSDTFGTCMGETEKAKTPIAVAGRVLAYPYRSRTKYNLGDAVCSAPNGTVDIMTRDEIMMYPERIVGTVSEIPNYAIWYGGSKESPTPIEVKGRIWIYVR